MWTTDLTFLPVLELKNIIPFFYLSLLAKVIQAEIFLAHITILVTHSPLCCSHLILMMQSSPEAGIAGHRRITLAYWIDTAALLSTPTLKLTRWGFPYIPINGLLSYSQALAWHTANLRSGKHKGGFREPFYTSCLPHKLHSMIITHSQACETRNPYCFSYNCDQTAYLPKGIILYMPESTKYSSLMQ